MKKQTPTNKFDGWDNGEVDRHLTALECYLFNHQMTEDELKDFLKDIDDANRELLKRVYEKSKTDEGWQVGDLRASLEAFRQKDED